MSEKISIRPTVDIDDKFADPALFSKIFGHCSNKQWSAVQVSSLCEEVIDEVHFPRYPSEQTQSQIHGHFGKHSVLEAFEFYKFIWRHAGECLSEKQFDQRSFLDFGSGWGRILRPFMRDIPLNKIIGFEPNTRYCYAARLLNPYVTFLNGGYLPDGLLPRKYFDLVVSWSVFSHLSRKAHIAWFRELANVINGTGRLVLTTWGMRFLERLARENEMLRSGSKIHWYSELCIKNIGNIEERIDQFKAAEFVWFAASSKSDLYGEAFMSLPYLKKMLTEEGIPLSVEFFDGSSLAQDVFVLSKISEGAKDSA